MIGPVEEVDVVGGDQGQIELLGELDQLPVADGLLLEPVVVHLEEEIFPAEDIGELPDAPPGRVEIAGQDERVDLAGDAAAQANDDLGMFVQPFLVDPRLLV